MEPKYASQHFLVAGSNLDWNGIKELPRYKTTAEIMKIIQNKDQIRKT